MKGKFLSHVIIWSVMQFQMALTKWSAIACFGIHLIMIVRHFAVSYLLVYLYLKLFSMLMILLWAISRYRHGYRRLHIGITLSWYGWSVIATYIISNVCIMNIWNRFMCAWMFALQTKSRDHHVRLAMFTSLTDHCSSFFLVLSSLFSNDERPLIIFGINISNTWTGSIVDL